jgi:hypothetical protein
VSHLRRTARLGRFHARRRLGAASHDTARDLSHDTDAATEDQHAKDEDDPLPIKVIGTIQPGTGPFDICLRRDLEDQRLQRAGETGLTSRRPSSIMAPLKSILQLLDSAALAPLMFLSGVASP